MFIHCSPQHGHQSIQIEFSLPTQGQASDARAKGAAVSHLNRNQTSVIVSVEVKGPDLPASNNFPFWTPAASEGLT